METEIEKLIVKTKMLVSKKLYILFEEKKKSFRSDLLFLFLLFPSGRETKWLKKNCVI